jgi:hypothetical protein
MCFKLGWFEQLCIYVIIFCATMAPPGTEDVGMAVIAIFTIYVILLSCIFGYGLSLMPRG